MSDKRLENLPGIINYHYKREWIWKEKTMHISYFLYKYTVCHVNFALLEKCGCPEGCFFRVWVSKKTPRHPAG